MKPSAVATPDQAIGPGPTGSEHAVIETNGLCKLYGKKPALVDLDLSVEAGEVFGFIGRNGLVGRDPRAARRGRGDRGSAGRGKRNGRRDYASTMRRTS